MNSSTLSKPGIKSELTGSVLDRLADKQWRLKNLYYIVDKNAKLIKFSPNEVQGDFNDKAWTRNIILKARQLGFTTNACISGLDDVLFNRNFNMVIIAHEKDAVTKIFKKVRVAWENFPEELKAMFGYKANTDSANELSFNNGSTIRVALSSRSDTVNRLHISEFGKICKKYPMKAEEIVTGAFPSVPAEGRIDIESTAEGDWGYFHDLFTEAEERGAPQAPKQFKAFFYPWTLDEEYALKGEFDIPTKLREYQEQHNLIDEQINWYYIEKQTQKDKMKQEYPTTSEEAFESSGHKLFNSSALDWQKQFVKDGRKVGDWIFYDKYIPSHRYAIGADVAEGVGQDSSTGIIIDFTKSKVVGRYKSNTIAPDMFAYELIKAGEKFGECLIAPERNNHGHATIAILRREYGNVYTEIKEDKTSDVQTKKLGWLTTGYSKPKMLFDANDAINEKLIAIPDKALLSELRSYDKEDLSQIRFDDEQTKHWDLVMAFAIAWQMKTEAGSSEVEVTENTYFDPYSPL